MAYRVQMYRPAGAKDSPVTGFLEELPEKLQAKIAAALDFLGQQGPALHRPHAAHVRGKLWELRVALARNEVRLLYFFLEGKIVVVAHGFSKKTGAIPARELETAERRMKDYEVRVKKGEVLP